ncbi:TrmH family RNA methyltransferase [Marixanthomonas ophiurae]|uniref:TrmH family RNA methyltransferase n=1 Tax=Marixanthomonas ophiurae TaxID=387659 RepID=A0A3E1Q7X5_9FLAO|nr:TrmH family RNA methyltransferase [Marixanthomonas ophiurae]RFN58239.1 TrmH family RNA methyltransferase [Marixanthomonas ophiurae]
MPNQLTHTSTDFPTKKFPIKVICDGVQSPANVGALFRVCEAFGVSEIIFCNTAVNFSSSRLLKTARNTNKTVLYRVSEDLSSEIKKLKKEQYKLLALELTDESIPLEKLQLVEGNKVALFVGNEKHGVSETVLNTISQSVHITMFGENSSLNVTQATGIALFTLTKLL